jgi:hypothetical protein
MLECKITDIKETLLAITNGDDHFVDSLLVTANIDIDNYLQKKQPYLTSQQIEEMIKSGFYFGGHTRDHLSLRNMSAQEQEKRIIESSLDISKRFNLDYQLCSLPHNDFGISDQVFINVSKQIDYLFGGYGLNHRHDLNYFQRISNEHSSLRIDKFINSWSIFHHATKNIRIIRKKILKRI